jgi:hypothetical protein
MAVGAAAEHARDRDVRLLREAVGVGHPYCGHCDCAPCLCDTEATIPEAILAALSGEHSAEYASMLERLRSSLPAPGAVGDRDSTAEPVVLSETEGGERAALG